MKITEFRIKNFKSIHDLYLKDIQNALILVGQNNTGKTTVLDAIRAVGGEYTICPEDFREDGASIEYMVALSISEDDLRLLHRKGIVSQYRRWEAWLSDFQRKLPSFTNQLLTFTMSANREGRIRYQDGFHKNNPYIPEVFPKIYHVDTERRVEQLQQDLWLLQEDEILQKMRTQCCIFNQARSCTQCFNCIGLIEQKSPKASLHSDRPGS